MAEERKLSRRDELLLQLTEAVLHMEPNCDLLWLARQNFLLEIRPCMLCDKPRGRPESGFCEEHAAQQVAQMRAVDVHLESD